MTGRNGLQIGRHAFGIIGLTAEESDELLDGLLRFAADEPSRTYYHQWEVGDLVVRALKIFTIFLLSVRQVVPVSVEPSSQPALATQVWDNRRVLHRACPYPHDEMRVFHGNRIGGDSSEAAINANDPLPGFEQLRRELDRLATNPGLQSQELELRAYFDQQMPAAVLAQKKQTPKL